MEYVVTLETRDLSGNRCRWNETITANNIKTAGELAYNKFNRFSIVFITEKEV